MAVEVTLDLQDRARTRWTSRGWEVDRVAFVEGLDAAAADRLRQAAQAAGIPALGDAHPTIADIEVEYVEPEPAGPTSAYVTIHYANPAVTSYGFGHGETAIIEVGASVVHDQASVDRNHQPITVSYTPPGGSSADFQASVPVLRPQATFTYSRRETGDPGDKALTYVGKVNSATFRGQAAGFWLCTSITGKSDDGGNNYNVTYVFQFNPGITLGGAATGWQPVVVHRDPSTGEPAAGADPAAPSNGYAVVLAYAAVDFNVLGLI